MEISIYEENKLDDAFSKHFQETDNGLMDMAIPSQDAQDVARKDLRNQAMSLAMEQNDRFDDTVMFRDPEYDRLKQEYDDSRGFVEGVDFGRPGGLPEGQEDAPQEFVTRGMLRERLAGQQQPQRRPLSDAEIAQTQQRMMARTPRRGSMLDPQFRKMAGFSENYVGKNAQEDREARMQAQEGFDWSMNTALRALEAGRLSIGETYGAISTFAGGIIQNQFGEGSLSDSLIDWGQEKVAETRIAMEGLNYDPETGTDLGPLPESYIVNMLQSLPALAADMGIATVAMIAAPATAGTSLAGLAVPVARRLVGSAAKKQVKKLSAEIVKKQAKARIGRRVFTSVAATRSFAGQFNDSYDEFVTNRGMDYGVALPRILEESFAAAGSTALAVQVQNPFFFLSPAARAVASTSLPSRLMTNFLVGGAAEGAQEAIELELTKAALSMVANLNDDDPRLEQIGWLKEGWFRETYGAFATGFLLGGPLGTLARTAQQSPRSIEDLTNAEVRAAGEEVTRLKEQEIAQRRQKAIATVEQRQEDFAKLSVKQLFQAVESAFGLRDFVTIGQGDTELTVSPLMAFHELANRGVSAGTINADMVQKVVMGDGATRPDQVPGAAQKTVTSGPIFERTDTYLAEALVAELDAADMDSAVDTLIAAHPEAAREIAALEGDVSRSALEKIAEKHGLGKFTSSKNGRNRLANAIRNRTQNIESARRSRAIDEAVSPEGAGIAMDATSREVIDNAIAQFNEETGVDLLSADADGGLDVMGRRVTTVRQRAEMLPDFLPIEERMQRISELQRREGKGQETAFTGEANLPEVKAVREALAKAKTEAEQQQSDTKEQVVGQRRRADRAKEQTQEQAELDRLKTEQLAQEQAAETAREVSDERVERDLEEGARSEQETDDLTREILEEEHGKAKADIIIAESASRANDDLISAKNARRVQRRNPVSPLAETVDEFAPPDEESVRESRSLFESAYERAKFEAAPEGTAETDTAPAEEIAVPKETEVFPKQNATKVKSARKAIKDGLVADAKERGGPALAARVRTFVDDGVTELTPGQRRVSKVAAKLGITVVFYDGVAENKRGFYDQVAPGVVGIHASLKTDQALYEVFWHEAVHDLEVRDPEAFRKMAMELYRIPEYRALLQKKMLEYDSAYRKAFADSPLTATLTEEMIESEGPALLAEVVAATLTEPELLDAMRSNAETGSTENTPDLRKFGPILKVLINVARKMGLTKDGKKKYTAKDANTADRAARKTAVPWSGPKGEERVKLYKELNAIFVQAFDSLRDPRGLQAGVANTKAGEATSPEALADAIVEQGEDIPQVTSGEVDEMVAEDPEAGVRRKVRQGKKLKADEALGTISQEQVDRVVEKFEDDFSMESLTDLSENTDPDSLLGKAIKRMLQEYEYTSEENQADSTLTGRLVRLQNERVGEVLSLVDYIARMAKYGVAIDKKNQDPISSAVNDLEKFNRRMQGLDLEGGTGFNDFPINQFKLPSEQMNSLTGKMAYNQEQEIRLEGTIDRVGADDGRPDSVSTLKRTERILRMRVFKEVTDAATKQLISELQGSVTRAADMSMSPTPKAKRDKKAGRRYSISTQVNTEQARTGSWASGPSINLDVFDGQIYTGSVSGRMMLRNGNPASMRIDNGIEGSDGTVVIATKTAANYALDLGLTVESQPQVTYDEAQVYRSLAEMGYAVEIASDIESTDNGFSGYENDSTAPVFTITSKPGPEQLRKTAIGNYIAKKRSSSQFSKLDSKAKESGRRFSLKDLTDPEISALEDKFDQKTLASIKSLEKFGVEMLQMVSGVRTTEGVSDRRVLEPLQSQISTVLADVIYNDVETARRIDHNLLMTYGGQARKIRNQVKTKLDAMYKQRFKSRMKAGSAIHGTLHPLLKEDLEDTYAGFAGHGAHNFIPGNVTTVENQKAFLLNADALLERHPRPFESETKAKEFFADLYRRPVTPIIPRGLIESFVEDKTLNNVNERQVQARREGMQLAQEFRKSYADGSITASGTGQLLMWGLMSRRASPYPHETAALHMFTSEEMLDVMEKVADGTAANWSEKKWASIQSKVIKNIPAAASSVSDNVNAAFKTMLPKLSQIDENTGKTYLQLAHDLFSDSSVTGRQLRRRMLTDMPVGIGIGNKVISFLALITGRSDVLVMDRVQITNMFGSSKTDAINVYDGTKDGGAGLSVLFQEDRSIVLYEALEDTISGVLQDRYRNAGLDPSDASLSAYHWDTWNSASGQAANHGSLNYMMKSASSQQVDFNVSPQSMGSSETRFGATAYGMTFVPLATREKANEPSPSKLLYEFDGNFYEFTEETWDLVSSQRVEVVLDSSALPKTDSFGRSFYKPGGVINEDYTFDDGTNALQNESGERIAWYDDQRIISPEKRQEWARIVEENGIRASSASVDEATKPYGTGTERRFSVVDMEADSRSEETASPEQQDMIAKLYRVMRRVANLAPPDADADQDIVIEESKKNPATSFLGKIYSPLHHAIIATKEGHPVREAIRRIIAIAMEMEVVGQREGKQDASVYNVMPKAWTGNNGFKFAQVMDQYVPLKNENSELDGNTEISFLETPESETPTKILVKDLPRSVRVALLHFKQRSETQREYIVKEKRDFVRRALDRSSNAQLLKMAKQESYGRPYLYEEIEMERIDNKTVFTTTDQTLNREQLIEELVSYQVPQDWGLQYAHFHHAFFGKYKLRAYGEDAEGNQIVYKIGDANTQAEAYEKLAQFKAGPEGSRYSRFEAKPAVKTDSPELVRLSGRARSKLIRELKRASDLEASEINAAMRGTIGLKQNAKPFFAPLMQRGETPAEGYSMNFARVWSMQSSNFNRWKYGGQIISETQPVIDKMQGSDPYWADFLEENVDRTLFIRPTTAETAIDTALQSIPYVGNLLGEMPVRRTLSAIRTLNYVRQLKTPRQWFVNSVQPLQTIYPRIGGKSFRKSVALYNSAEGKAILEKYGRMDSSSGMYVDGSESSMGEGLINTVTKGQELLDKHLLKGMISSQSESRNMNFAFIAFYQHGLEMGMTEAEAVNYGRVEGFVGSQFAYTRANLPPILNGPIASTLLQYKRFQINMIGFAHQLLKEKNYSGLGRWLLVNTIVSGIKGLVFTLLPIYYGGVGICKLLGLCEEMGNPDNDAYRARNMLIDQVGEETANMITFGLPAILGADVSGSFSLFKEPYGRTFGEKVFSEVQGPTLGTITDMYDALTADTVQPVTVTEATYSTLKDTGPAFKWLANMAEYLSGYTEEYDDRGRLRFRDEDKGRGLWMELGGAFRTVNESVWSLEFDRLKVLREVNDSYMGRASMLYSSGKIAEAVELIRKHNAAYPYMAFNVGDLQSRIDNKREAIRIPQNERRSNLDASKRVARAFAAEQR